mgnify:CR=1 FL=1
MIILELFLVCIATLLIANLAAKAYVVTTLKRIETYTGMYGSAGEVEAMYIGTLVIFSEMDLMRRFIFRKPDITWAVWFDFVKKELKIDSGSIPPLHFKPIKTYELADVLKKFREENF